MTRAEALQLVSDARDEAEAKYLVGALSYTSADAGCPTELWLAALMEELGEVARCVHDNDHANLPAELAQLAGVAVGRLEAIA